MTDYPLIDCAHLKTFVPIRNTGGGDLLVYFCVFVLVFQFSQFGTPHQYTRAVVAAVLHI